MTAGHDLARLAAKALGRRLDEQRPPPADRDRGISIVAQAMVGRSRRKRTVRWVLGLAGAFSVLALAGAVPFIARDRSRELPSAACSGACTGREDAPPGGDTGTSSYPPGSRIRAGDAPLSVSFGDTVTMQLSANTELVHEYDAGVRRFRLTSGSVQMDVDGLERRQRLIVETQDTEVEVRGTRFNVAWLAGDVDCAARTRVEVSEGVVEVRSEGAVREVTVGKSWLGRCHRPSLPTSSSAVLAPASTLPQRRLERSVSDPSASQPSLAPSALEQTKALASSLSLQNELYGRATAARRAGQLAVALSLHESLIQRYPAGPLVESSSIERVRILAKIDKAKASAAARQYLERFPHGFARDEARGIAAR